MVLDPQRWKYAIVTNIFYRIRICSFFLHLARRRYHSTAKSMIFPNVKNLVHTQSNSDTIARWSSITFFLYTLYNLLYNSNKSNYTHHCSSAKHFFDQLHAFLESLNFNQLTNEKIMMHARDDWGWPERQHYLRSSSAWAFHIMHPGVNIVMLRFINVYFLFLFCNCTVQYYIICQNRQTNIHPSHVG